jgi:hypothetical protein
MTYPNEPGWKEGDTSREAAESMSLRAIRLRKLSYDFIRHHPEHTADEIANALDESILAIRPRISELRRMEYIRNHGRGTNRSGKAAHKWVVCDDVDVTAEEINARFMIWWPQHKAGLRRLRHQYVAALNELIDKVVAEDEKANRELKAELDDMQLVLDQAYEWVRL